MQMDFELFEYICRLLFVVLRACTRLKSNFSR